MRTPCQPDQINNQIESPQLIVECRSKIKKNKWEEKLSALTNEKKKKLLKSNATA